MSGKSIDFFKISEKALIVKIIGICHKHQIPIVCWLKDQSLRFETKTHHYYQHLSKLALTMPTDLKSKDLLDAFAAQGSNNLFISFQIDTVNFFLKTDVSSISDDAEAPHLSVVIPKELFKLQRRANLRIPFKRAAAPRLTCLDPSKDLSQKKIIEASDVLAFRMLDVSAGGFAISVPDTEDGKFKIGQIIDDIKFFIKGTEVICRAVVRHKKSTKNDKDQHIVRLGLQFTTLKPEHEKLISQYVLDESRKIFSLLH